MVKWMQIEGKVVGVKVEEIACSTVLDLPWDRTNTEIVVPLTDVNIDFDLKRLMAPLGDYWKTLYDAEDFAGIKDALRKYWSHKGIPKIVAEVAETETEHLHLRNKIVVGEKAKKSMLSLNKIITEVNQSFQYTRTLIGSDGGNLEMQLLDAGSRKAVKPGDFVDCGIFLNINGAVRVSPGINRLVCTNGLTQRFYLWENDTYNIGPEYIQRATAIADWLARQGERRIAAVREVSVVLKDYPKPLLNRYWKTWGERIDLNELTWFDVIDDLTRAANRTLGGMRYKLLNLQEPIALSEAEACRCPTCSASVERG